MTAFLRIIGILNASVWFGAAVFFTFGVGPGFFTEEMKRLLPAPYNGAAAELMIGRFFILMHICGGVAILHLLAENLYAGKKIRSVLGSVLAGIFLLGLAGNFWLQPKMHQLLVAKYRGSTPEIRAEAAKDFGMWHGVSQSLNLLILPGLLFYLWQMALAESVSRSSAFRPVSVELR